MEKEPTYLQQTHCIGQFAQHQLRGLLPHPKVNGAGVALVPEAQATNSQRKTNMSA